MKSLDEFLSITPTAGHARKISEEHKRYLQSRYPSYDVKTQIWLYRNGVETEPRCEHCGNVVQRPWAKTCSVACRDAMLSKNTPQRREKFVQTCLEKYGVDNPGKRKETHEKRLATMVERYGAKVSPNARESTKQRSDELNRKGRETLSERHGVKNPAQLKDHGEKCRATLFENYGVERYYHSAAFKDKQQTNRYSKWNGVVPASITIHSIDEPDLPEFENPNARVTIECHTCGNTEVIPTETLKWRVSTVKTPCRHCGGLKKGSAEEGAIADFVAQYTTVVRNDRSIISPMEIDIYLPEFKTGIEYHGLYWHSESVKGRMYHREKLDRATAAGIRLIQIFEDEWTHHPAIVKDRILHIIKKSQSRVYARQCQVRGIQTKQASEFLSHAHIQGPGRSNIRLGLFHHDDIVAVMTFLKNDRSKNIEGWELNRFAAKPGYSVVGAASKLFSHFIKEYDPETVLSFADARWCSESPVYLRMGFKDEGMTAPGYWYLSLDKVKRIHRFALRKPAGCQLTERELRASEGYLRIYDAGHRRFRWNRAKYSIE